jgi:high affinity Mn2+ porin
MKIQRVRFARLSNRRFPSVPSNAVKKFLRRSAAIVVLGSGAAANAADLDAANAVPTPAADPAPVWAGWSGFYIGAHAGIANGRSPWSATQPRGAPLTGAINLYQPVDAFDGSGSHFGGFGGGYNYQFRSGLVAGIEIDLSVPGAVERTQNFASSQTGAGIYADALKMSGTARARLGLEGPGLFGPGLFGPGLLGSGFGAGHWLWYTTGGLAWTDEGFTRTQVTAGPSGPPAGAVEQVFVTRLGWTIGAGVEAPVLPGWTAKAEYLYSQFPTTAVAFPLAGQTFRSELDTHQVRFGLNYKLGDLPADWTKPLIPAIETDAWALHGQMSFVSQYAAPFHAPYHGGNSLDSNAGRETWDATLYVGRRLWDGAELWINPEIDQGFGLSNTLGVAGFTSGEAYKVGNTYPYFRVPRAFIRQTIDLGGAEEKIEGGINQFAGKQTADRLVLTAGKFSVSDIFDTISYAHDPRNDFLNWSLVDAGTFDYAADAWGYTYGAAAEWYRGSWTLRTGLFDLSAVPNSSEIDPTFRQFQFVYELEHRHEIAGQPGKLAVLGFLTRGRMGRFDDAVAFAQQNGTTPSTADVRRYASRTGVNVNFEQQLVPNIGFFARAGWADGNVEPFEFTDVDRTASAGLSLNGKLWNRPNDAFGIAGVVNGISSAHAAYLDAGGLGILVGDGQLPHRGPEQILETCYSLPLGDWLAGNWRFTADYQFIVNPAYNRDRGPVSIIGARLRTQF